MNGSNIATIYLKELRDLLRDRRTLLSMIVIPTLLMPAIMLGFAVLTYKAVRQARATAPTVMLIGGEDSPRARAAVMAAARFRFVPATSDWQQRISEKKVRAVVELPAGFDAALADARPADVKIYHYESEMRSSFAVNELRRFLIDYRERVVSERLEAQGLSGSLVRPFEIRTQNVAPPEKVGGNVVGGIIPYLFILLAFTGAMYPAMDLTAGEKERGTMEAILCSPVARIDLVLGKFLMVLTASLGTVVCSLLSMSLTFLVGGAWFASTTGGPALAQAAASAMVTASGAGPTLPSLDPLGLVAVLLMILPMAVLFSATLLTISLFARSFKEAQSYTSPLVILIIMPAAVVMLPGIELNAQLALVPILNVSLVSKELVSGVWHWHYLALIFGSTCVYAAGALVLAVRMFNREDVILRT